MNDKPNNIENHKTITAEELNLDINSSFLGVTSTEDPAKYEFESGNDVLLKKGDIWIRVKNATTQPDGSINGELQSVEPYHAMKSLNIGEQTKITFSLKHVFTASAK